MQIEKIRQEIEAEVEKLGCFIVDIQISKDNDIELTIESEDGIVQMEDCVNINKRFGEIFDREVEDYALTVSSAGLDQAFKVIKQYKKYLGSEIELRLKGGKKLITILEDVNDEGIRVRYTQKEAVEGKKKKELVEKIEFYNFTQINSACPYIVF